MKHEIAWLLQAIWKLNLMKQVNHLFLVLKEYTEKVYLNNFGSIESVGFAKGVLGAKYQNLVRKKYFGISCSQQDK